MVSRGSTMIVVLVAVLLPLSAMLFDVRFQPFVQFTINNAKAHWQRIASSVLSHRSSHNQLNNEFYSLTANSLIGLKPIPMRNYAGRVILVINVASECGFTDDAYAEMRRLEQLYREKGLEILAFPCNQFGGQEPGMPRDIFSFVRDEMKSSCTLFDKVNVNGPKTHPIFMFLKKAFPGDVTWSMLIHAWRSSSIITNSSPTSDFHGIWLIDRKGQPVRRYNTLDFGPIEGDIKVLLGQVN